MEIRDQRVVILGGASGIGLATAHALAARGATVTIAGRTEEKLARAAASAPHPLLTAVVDATSEAALKTFFSRQEHIDHLVLTLSGGKGGGPFAALTAEVLRQAFDAKFFAQVQAVLCALPYLAETGSITFTTAASARASMPGTAGLAAVNGALEAMIRPLARELKPRRVNAVSPGVIETPWWDALPASQREALLERAAEMTLVGRNGRADEVAEAIAFVVTNGFVTGSVIEVDGGIRLS